jgi:hypothetical protein
VASFNQSPTPPEPAAQGAAAEEEVNY